jgi:hypothetical protein|tara:strand:- start:191 stop:760 length:570 start_codon:yes stop_codon:yes gene_type:complete
MIDPYKMPIPGQSLTDSPRNAPWERPPEMVEPNAIAEYYIRKLSDDELMQDLSVVFDLGGDLKSMTEAMMNISVSQGMHTLEGGLVVAPVVGSYIKMAMAELGVDVKETNRDPEVETTGRETMRLRSLITDALEKDAKDGGTSSGVLEEMQQGMDDSPDDVMDDSMQEEPVIEETQEDIPTGLMSKGNV